MTNKSSVDCQEEKSILVPEYPIVFDTHSVMSILNTNADHSPVDPSKPIKWQSRRIIKCKNKILPLPERMEPYIDGDLGAQEVDNKDRPMWLGYHTKYLTGIKWFSPQWGKVGDHLWVRETWTKVPRTAYSQSPGVWQSFSPDNNHDAIVYKAGWERSEPSQWLSPIFLPRWGSRISLKLTGIRVERLQDISYSDIIAEGLAVYEGTQLLKPELPLDQAVYKDQWIRRWNSINKKRGYPWDINPWVWVLEFHRI
ncbi:MAG TPA: hypothetical protein VIQ31_08240 [Phormidium sp.]